MKKETLFVIAVLAIIVIFAIIYARPTQNVYNIAITVVEGHFNQDIDASTNCSVGTLTGDNNILGTGNELVHV